MAFTIGLVEPSSRRSEWNQPALGHSSVTPSARMQQCLPESYAWLEHRIVMRMAPSSRDGGPTYIASAALLH